MAQLNLLPSLFNLGQSPQSNTRHTKKLKNPTIDDDDQIQRLRELLFEIKTSATVSNGEEKIKLFEDGIRLLRDKCHVLKQKRLHSNVRKRKHDDDISDEMKPAPKKRRTVASCEIKNALVLLCCIEDYNKKRTGYNPLPGAIKDEIKLTKLFTEKWGFKVMSPEIASYDPAQHGKRVKMREFDTFLNVKVRTEHICILPIEMSYKNFHHITDIEDNTSKYYTLSLFISN